jgi:glycolate oxidase FAD binding subunit
MRRPESVPELGDLVRHTASEGQAVYPIGGQTTLDLGWPPTRKGIAIDLRGLARVIDYPARDMTITVEAGITLTQLQEVLKGENQRLPVDVPRATEATLGGVLATNPSGPRRYGFGTLRDYVIGIRVINNEGQEIKAGGRVVKNVAGYDLCKLYVGSLGTLGVITQVTLKLRPLPDEEAVVLVPCSPEQMPALLDRLHGSRTRPVCLDLLSAGAAALLNLRFGVGFPQAPWVLVIGFEDNRTAVGWQVQQVVTELSASSGLEVRAGATAGPVWQALTEFPAIDGPRLTWKANLLPSAAAAFCLRAAARPEQLSLLAHAGSGIVIGHAADDLTLDDARIMLKSLLDEAAASQGNMIVPRCPPTWKASLPIWGSPRGDAWLMRAVKQALDPRGLFNPGRFVDGI